MKTPVISQLGLTHYIPVWQSMQAFTHNRNQSTPDELWVTEHHPVYTQGHNGKPQHLLNTADIPVVQVDRGGQVTYHGPGQTVIYCLFDLNRLRIGVRELVSQLEQSVISLLGDFSLSAHRKDGAPGVYINNAKIAALGLRVRKGFCYHGLSFNINCDLSPFTGINPCGYQGLQVTRLSDHLAAPDNSAINQQLVQYILESSSERIQA